VTKLVTHQQYRRDIPHPDLDPRAGGSLADPSLKVEINAVAHIGGSKR